MVVVDPEIRGFDILDTPLCTLTLTAWLVRSRPVTANQRVVNDHVTLTAANQTTENDHVTLMAAANQTIVNDHVTLMAAANQII